MPYQCKIIASTFEAVMDIDRAGTFLEIVRYGSHGGGTYRCRSRACRLSTGTQTDAF